MAVVVSAATVDESPVDPPFCLVSFVVLVEAGATLVAQDEPTSVVWGMPGAAAMAGICSALLPLKSVAGYINDYVAKGMP